MMIVKFNKFERVAGLFVGLAFFGGILFTLGVAVKQGWFDAKSYYSTSFTNADGIHPGTTVQMAGLKAGSVDEVELLQNNKIHVKFYVLSKFQDKIKEDSIAQLTRPFIIGDRVLDISVGTEDSKLLASDSTIASHEAVDLMSLLSGKSLGSTIEDMSSMLGNLRTLAEAFLNKDRTEAMIRVVDRIDPLLKNLNIMSLEVIKLSKQATKDENLQTVLGTLATTTRELNKLLPDIAQRAPAMAKNIEGLVHNLARLTDQVMVFMPALAEMAPKVPEVSHRAIEALDEAVVLMKALQKTWIIRSAAKEVREEERIAKKAAQKERMPANSEE
jgi:phospholipid/cholesterol/gamma-HCH transport system substrate-binding protein